MNILSSISGEDREFVHERALIYDNILYIFAGERIKGKADFGEESLQIYVFSIIGKKADIEDSNNMFVDVKEIGPHSVVAGGKNSSIEFPVAGIRIVR